MKRYIRSQTLADDLKQNLRPIFQELHKKGFDSSRATNKRWQDCISDDIFLPHYTHNEDIIADDNGLPIELIEIPGKYLWIGSSDPDTSYASIANTSINIAEGLNGSAIDFTPDTGMFFIFIPE